MPIRHKHKPYRHIQVKDRTSFRKKIRTVTITCPLEYPGLNEPERRKMYEGLSMIADAYRAADRRCLAKHNQRRK